MPDGVVIMIADTVGIVLQELAVVAEQGASYFSVTGGLLLKLPNGMEGGAGVIRLRGQIGGDPSAPDWKIDGFWVLAKGPTFELEVGGFFKEFDVDDTHVREFGFTGTFGLQMDAKWLFGLDLLAGTRTSPDSKFDYFMLAAFFRGSIKIGVYFELRGARLLFSANTRPKLGPVDASSRDLRYFKWYRDTNPIVVKGTRRLEAWQAEKDAWSFGVGVSASIPPVGAVVEFSVFVLGVGGPSESGLLIVAEVMLLSSPKPVAYAAIEWDIKHDRISALVGIAATIDNFFESAPSWVSAIGKLTGTMYISNDPPTFAIRRLADQRTWLTMSAGFDLRVVRQQLLFALCVEIVGDGGPKGFGLVARLEGGFDCGIVAVDFSVGLAFQVAFFTTGSIDYALVLTLDAALRLTVFVVFQFRIAASLELRVVGSSPTRRRAARRVPAGDAVVHPRRHVHVPDRLGPDRGRRAGDLRAAAALLGGQRRRPDRKSLPVHIERAADSRLHRAGAHAAVLDPGAARAAGDRGRAAAALRRGPGRAAGGDRRDDPDRLHRLGQRQARARLPHRCPIWATRSPATTLTGDLVGLTVRRRPRFGASRPWSMVDQRIELAADFSDPDGVKLAGLVLAPDADEVLGRRREGRRPDRDRSC